MFSSTKNVNKNQEGFSLVELLAVLPITTMLVVILIAALFSQYANSLAESARTSLRANGQTILVNLQDELLFTIAYGEDLEGRLIDPNEPSGGWSFDTDPATLIINEIALDSTRRDEDRHIVRQYVNNCESSSVTANPLAVNNVIYFIEDVPDSEYDRLVKRTVTPEYDYCSIDASTGNPCTPTTANCKGNAKVTTCPEILVGTDNCEAEDSILTENVIDFEVKYFAENNIETAYPSDADKLELVLTLGDKTFGRRVETEVKHTIRKIN